VILVFSSAFALDSLLNLIIASNKLVIRLIFSSSNSSSLHSSSIKFDKVTVSQDAILLKSSIVIDSSIQGTQAITLILSAMLISHQFVIFVS
jgi:hypothetical protein